MIATVEMQAFQPGVCNKCSVRVGMFSSENEDRKILCRLNLRRKCYWFESNSRSHMVLTIIFLCLNKFLLFYIPVFQPVKVCISPVEKYSFYSHSW